VAGADGYGAECQAVAAGGDSAVAAAGQPAVAAAGQSGGVG